MIRVALISPDGERHELSASAGTALMQAAKNEGVPGIDADCGGCMVCGTCHVYVAPEWQAHLPQPSEMERMILESVPVPRPDARLSCQLVLAPDLDGLCVRIPERQR
jgi:ferredoxin, 2Fe-2S